MKLKIQQNFAHFATFRSSQQSQIVPFSSANKPAASAQASAVVFHKTCKNTPRRRQKLHTKVFTQNKFCTVQTVAKNYKLYFAQKIKNVQKQITEINFY